MTISLRRIKQIIEPQLVIEGADVLLRRSFGPNRTNLYDPFLLFDHFAFNDPSDSPLQGFPTHPHRGIETVTYMLEGIVRHRDSLGNQGIIGPGDVQWMTSGRGIMHEELPQRSPAGLVKGFQLWVNLPAALKMSQPRYQEVSAETIPAIEENGAKIRLIAGEYHQAKGPVSEIANQPIYLDVTLNAGAEFSLPVPQGNFALAYLFEGEAIFGLDEQDQGEHIQAVHMLVFDDGDAVRVRAAENSQARFVFMAGTPFGEPIAPYGPFVMNTQEEIQQALRDLRNGTFVQN